MQQMLVRFNRLFKRMDDCYRQAAKASGLPECTFWILYFLREDAAPITQHELCQRMLQAKQTVNTALKKMEADGWIRLSPAPADRRSRLLELTPSGQEVARRTADVVLKAEKEAYACFSASERQLYLSLLEKHAQALHTVLPCAFKGDAK